MWLNEVQWYIDLVEGGGGVKSRRERGERGGMRGMSRTHSGVGSRLGLRARKETTQLKRQ